MGDFQVEQIPIPAALDGLGGADFVASVEVRNASESHGYGTTEVAYPAEEMLPQWHDPYEPKVLWVARMHGRIVGRAVHESQLGPGGTLSQVGWIDIDVHPEAEGHGIGRALADTVEGYARSLGQTRLICYAVSPASTAPGAELIRPPTGFGAVPAGNREVRFLLARGYRLEQVERASRFALPGDLVLLAELRESAERDAGRDYAMHRWAGPTPREWLADMATLLTRMSTDAPTAGLEEPEDIWSPARVEAFEQRVTASPRQTLTTVVEHRPTGRLAAFSQLTVPHDPSRPVSQEDTLVLREFRGHRLGTVVKTANLEFLQSVDPGHPSVLTWNAEENRYMLAVNEVIGFVPIGYEGAWRSDL
ncbi:MAG: family N-acetyltransferase [Subtercola sp.]|nr:family N-acetyltransferase [Subtercola sp.]